MLQVTIQLISTHEDATGKEIYNVECLSKRFYDRVLTPEFHIDALDIDLDVEGAETDGKYAGIFVTLEMLDIKDEELDLLKKDGWKGLKELA